MDLVVDSYTQGSIHRTFLSFWEGRKSVFINLISWGKCIDIYIYIYLYMCLDIDIHDSY